jgi:phosphoribosylanthranilate isomerase
MTQLKICGVRPHDDLSFSSSPIVTHVGFVFVPASRRYVTPEQAHEMIERVDETCQSVGVFVDLTQADVETIAQTSGIDCIQLHGQESPQMCQNLRTAGYAVWKAIQVPNSLAERDRILHQIVQYAPHVDGLLFDTAPPKRADFGVSGGHGVAFDWSALPQVIAQARTRTMTQLPPIWVAGGLHPKNVQSLLSTFSPFGLDVSSGVEEGTRKSNTKIMQMIEAVSDGEQRNHLS